MGVKDKGKRAERKGESSEGNAVKKKKEECRKLITAQDECMTSVAMQR